MRELQEAQNAAAMERVHADRRSRAQTQEFATLTAELLAARQGPQVELHGMRFGIKVEKPANYDGDKGQDLDTWLPGARAFGFSYHPSCWTCRIRCFLTAR